MSNRYHSKYHRRNHHTYTNINIPDAGHDPIASVNEPFLGEFILSGSLSAVAPLSSYAGHFYSNNTAICAIGGKEGLFIQGTNDGIQVFSEFLGLSSYSWLLGSSFASPIRAISANAGFIGIDVNSFIRAISANGNFLGADIYSNNIAASAYGRNIGLEVVSPVRAISANGNFLGAEIFSNNISLSSYGRNIGLEVVSPVRAISANGNFLGADIYSNNIAASAYGRNIGLEVVSPVRAISANGNFLGAEIYSDNISLSSYGRNIGLEVVSPVRAISANGNFLGADIYSNNIAASAYGRNIGLEVVSPVRAISANGNFLGADIYSNNIAASAYGRNIGLEVVSPVRAISANGNFLGLESFSNNISISSYGRNIGLEVVSPVRAISANGNFLGADIYSNNISLSSYGRNIGLEVVSPVRAISANGNFLGLESFSNNISISSYGRNIGLEVVSPVRAISANGNFLGLESFSNNISISSYGRNIGLEVVSPVRAISANGNFLGAEIFSNNISLSSYGRNIGLEAVSPVRAISANGNFLGAEIYSDNISLSSYGRNIGLEVVSPVRAISANGNFLGLESFSNNISISSYGRNIGLEVVSPVRAISANGNFLGAEIFSNNISLSSYGRNIGLEVVSPVRAISANGNFLGAEIYSDNISISSYGRNIGLEVVSPVRAISANGSLIGIESYSLNTPLSTAFGKNILHGRVGVNVNNPSMALDLIGDSTFDGNVTITGNLSTLGYITRLDTYVEITSAVNILNKGTGPALSVTQEGTQPIAHFIDSNGDDIVFDDDGKVGLGTYTPQANIHIVENGSNPEIRIQSEVNTYNPTIRLAGNDTITNEGLEIIYDNSVRDTYIKNISNNSEKAFHIQTGLKEAITINTDGKIGIGETIPEGLLHVKSGSAGSVTAPPSSVGIFESDSNCYISLLSPNSKYSGVVMGGPTNPYGSYLSWNHDNLDLKLATNHANADIQFLVATEQEAMRITPTGNVGIGTTSPNEKLTVTGNISSNNTIYSKFGVFNNQTGQEGGQITLTDSSGSGAWEIDNYVNTLRIFRDKGVADVTALHILTSGNVGIGTGTPNDKLTIVGNLSTTGKINNKWFDPLDFNYVSLREEFGTGGITSGTIGQLGWNLTGEGAQIENSLTTSSSSPMAGSLLLRAPISTITPALSVVSLYLSNSPTFTNIGLSTQGNVNTRTAGLIRQDGNETSWSLQYGRDGSGSTINFDKITAPNSFGVRYISRSTAAWNTPVSYSIGNNIRPTSANGFKYIVTTAGASYATYPEPTWTTTLKSTVTAFASNWASSTSYANGFYVKPTTTNAYKYKNVAGTGTSHTVQPTWPTTVGNLVADTGIAVWASSTSYSLNSTVRPTVVTSGGYKYVNQVSGTTTSHTVQPTWPTTVGNLVADTGIAVWAASTSYALNATVRPTVVTTGGFRYRCTVAGTSGATQPTWPTTVGTTVVSGGATFICEAGGYPVWQTQAGDYPVWSTEAADYPVFVCAGADGRSDGKYEFFVTGANAESNITVYPSTVSIGTGFYKVSIRFQNNIVYFSINGESEISHTLSSTYNVFPSFNVRNDRAIASPIQSFLKWGLYSDGWETSIPNL